MTLAQGAPIFMVTLDYNPSEMAGPPFPLSHTRMRELFKDPYQPLLIESRESLNDNPGLASRGLTGLTESVWLLTSKVA